MTVAVTATIEHVAEVERHDPGIADAWWWLGIPLLSTLSLLVIARVAPQFYLDWILPEAYGALEVLHVLLPAIGFIVGLLILRLPGVRAWPLAKWAAVLFSASCLFIAGEECSWGQWFFYWETPEYWGQLNRQNETNLHNTSYFFNHFLRNILKVAVIVGGIILPLMPMQMRGPFASIPILRMLVPPGAIVPVSLATVGFDLMTSASKGGGINIFVPRPSEAVELFMYMFILFYMVMFWRRARLL